MVIMCKKQFGVSEKAWISLFLFSVYVLTAYSYIDHNLQSAVKNPQFGLKSALKNSQLGPQNLTLTLEKILGKTLCKFLKFSTRLTYFIPPFPLASNACQWKTFILSKIWKIWKLYDLDDVIHVFFISITLISIHRLRFAQILGSKNRKIYFKGR